NGDTVVAYTDEQSAYQRGRIALETYAPGTLITFKKIEIKELPPEEPGWVQLFNGRDLTGWRKPGPDSWKVENGQLQGSGRGARLWTERSDFANFHLRMEAKCAKGGGGLRLRTQADRPESEVRGYAIGLHLKDLPTGSISVF